MVMAKARQRAEWDRAAVIAAEVHNSAFGREKLRSPADFHPYEQAKRKSTKDELPEIPFETLKLIFVKDAPPPPATAKEGRNVACSPST